MIRNGNYTKYNGKEYRVITDKTGRTYLLSTNKAELKNGFHEYASGVFQKKVDQKELDDVYYIHPYAIYKGKEFDAIVNKKANTVNLGTSNATIAGDMGFTRTDKYYYEKNVSINEVSLIEKKEKL